MLILVIAVAAIGLLTYFILQQPMFGRAPQGARKDRILKSPHYKNGRFDNLNKTPQLAEDTSMPEVMFRFLFDKTKNKFPAKAFHFVKTDLKTIPLEENIYVWLGHSSYYLQLDGKRLLADPVLSGYASPFSFSTKAFKGADLYKPADLPPLDYLIITHDHWDHLDFATVKELFPTTKKIITGLGTGEHLEFWGYPVQNIIELDWYESAELGDGFRITAEPARHFSGRGLRRDQAIWASFLLQNDTKKIYIGGDSGYDKHFKEIGKKYGEIDLAILENGQYNKDWRYIHLLPGENLRAMKDLNAKRMIPVHNSKFSLAVHSWNEPLEEMYRKNTENLRILFPKIGEKIAWEDDSKIYPAWWREYN